MHSLNRNWTGIKIEEIDRFGKEQFGIEPKISRTTKWRILKELCESGLLKIYQKSYGLGSKMDEYKKQYIRNNHYEIRKFLEEWDKQ